MTAKITALALELNAQELCRPGVRFWFEGNEWEVTFSGKPQNNKMGENKKGEPKTDVYMEAKMVVCPSVVFGFAFSIKKKNYGFIENKPSLARIEACNLLPLVQSDSFQQVSAEFISNKNYGTIYLPAKQQFKVQMGFRMDIMTTGSGSFKKFAIEDTAIIEECYAGKKQPHYFRDAIVDGRIVVDSGIANRIVVADKAFNTLQEFVDASVSIKDYIKGKKAYFALKGVNFFYGDQLSKWDGNRLLAISISHKIQGTKELSTGSKFSVLSGTPSQPDFSKMTNEVGDFLTNLVKA